MKKPKRLKPGDRLLKRGPIAISWSDEDRDRLRDNSIEWTKNAINECKKDIQRAEEDLAEYRRLPDCDRDTFYEMEEKLDDLRRTLLVLRCGADDYRRENAANAVNIKRTAEADNLAREYMQTWASLYCADPYASKGDLDTRTSEEFKGVDKRYEDTIRKWRRKYATYLQDCIDAENARKGDGWG
jgi:phage terminase large subunit-like protein